MDGETPKNPIKNQKWRVLQLDRHVIILPNSDILPHGRKITDGHYKIDDECALTCECGPKVEIGNSLGLYSKIFVYHNSFQDKQRVDNAMANL